MIPDELRYTEEHEWVGKADDLYVVGITHYAQEQLGDITYVELPEDDLRVEQGDETAVVESVKAASDIYAPVGGVVAEVNESLDSAPDVVNRDPYGAGWFFKLREVDPEELDALMDASQYRAFVDDLSE